MSRPATRTPHGHKLTRTRDVLAAASLLLVTLHALAAAALLVVLVLLGGDVVLEGRHGIKLRQLAHIDVLGILPRRECGR